MKEPPLPPLPPALANKIMSMKTASENLETLLPIDLMGSRESLHAAVRCSSHNLSDIESRGNLLSDNCRIIPWLKCTSSKSAPISAASRFTLPLVHLSSPLTSFLPRSWIRSYSWGWSFAYYDTSHHTRGGRRERKPDDAARVYYASSSAYGIPTRPQSHAPASRRVATSFGRRLESARTAG